METTQNSNIIRQADLEKLPLPVASWLKNAGIVGKSRIKSLYLKQNLSMKMKPEQKKWFPATAEQWFSIPQPGFEWKVRMSMSPFMKVRGRDQFYDGKGEMKIKLFNIFSVVNEKGPKMDEGTMQRYLGEMVWFPSAALSEFIKWEAIDSLSAKATMKFMGTEGSGIFYFNEKNEFIKFKADRFMGNEPGAEKKEWIIEVQKSEFRNGIKIPVKMQASWMLDDGKWTWLDLEISEIQYQY